MSNFEAKIQSQHQSFFHFLEELEAQYLKTQDDRAEKSKEITTFQPDIEQISKLKKLKYQIDGVHGQIMEQFRIDKILHRRGTQSMQSKFQDNMDGFISSYEEMSRLQQTKVIENKELLQQIETAQLFRNPNELSAKEEVQPQLSNNIFDLPLEQPQFPQFMTTIEIADNDDPFMSPNKSYTMPQIDQIEQAPPVPRKRSRPQTFHELHSMSIEADELEEFRMEIKQKLLKKLEQEDKRLKQGMKD